MSNIRKALPWRVRLLVGGAAVAASVCAYLISQPAQHLGPSEIIMVVVFGSLAAASHFRPTWTNNQQSIYNTVTAAYFAMTVVLPAPLIAPVILISWVPWIILRVRANPSKFVEVIFNVSMDLVAAAATRAVINLGHQLTVPVTLAVMTGAVVYVLTQTALVTAIIMVHRRVPLREVDALKPGILSAELTTVMVGGITALLYTMDPWSLGVLFVPLGYLQYMMEKVQNQNASLLDPKTGLYNFKFLDEKLPKEVERAKASGSPLSVVFADLDFLREVNNTYGHLAGDVAIQQVGKTLKNCLTLGDQFCARFGGEEYVLVLPNTDIQTALRIAETARAKVAESTITAGDATFRVTMSFGVAAVPDHALTVRDLIHAADMAVYQAKAGGRNCVRVYGKEVTEACAVSR